MESQLNHNVSAGYIAPCPQCGYFLKEPSTYPLGIYWVNEWVLSKSTQHLPAGYLQANLLKTHNEPTMYPQGK
jgi:hypothetical protein